MLGLQLPVESRPSHIRERARHPGSALALVPGPHWVKREEYHAGCPGYVCAPRLPERGDPGERGRTRHLQPNRPSAEGRCKVTGLADVRDAATTHNHARREAQIRDKYVGYFSGAGGVPGQLDSLRRWLPSARVY